jgi:Flp pilus assembly protein TadD
MVAGQRREVVRGVSADLAEWDRLRAQERWPEARAVLTRAAERLSGGAGESLRERVGQAQRDLDLAVRLEEVRIQKVTPNQKGDWDSAGAEQAYRDTFRAWGLDVQGLEADEMARRVMGSAIREQLIAALDDWVSLKSALKVEGRERLLVIAQQADENELRRRIRAAREQKDRAELESLARRARTEDLPAPTLLLLGMALWETGSQVDSERVLEQGQHRYPGDLSLNLWLGMMATREWYRTGEAVGFFRAALAAHPDNLVLRYTLGVYLHQSGHSEAALTAFREAIRLKKDHAKAHCGLGLALQAKGDLGGALGAFREAIRLNKDNPTAHLGLGATLQGKGDVDGAVAAFREAIRLKPDDPDAHFRLGLALDGRRDTGGAIAAYREAIRLKPNFPEAHCNLGGALKRKGDLGAAITAYREAIRLKKDFAEAHCGLGLALRNQGHFGEALEALRTSHALGSRKARWDRPSARWVAEVERLVELDGKLPAILRGQAKPASATEALELARLCACKRHHAASVRFYADAFARKPDLAEDLGAGHRYNAACSAALAAAGSGEDAGTLDEKERTRWRRQALAWLRADLDGRGRQLASKDAKAVKDARARLEHWQKDAELAGVRDAPALAALPGAERQEWQKLWDEVARLLDQPLAGSGKP